MFSLVLHGVLAACLLCALPVSAPSGPGGPLVLSLLSLPGSGQGEQSRPEKQAVVPEAAAKSPAPAESTAPEMSRPKVRKNSATDESFRKKPPRRPVAKTKRQDTPAAPSGSVASLTHVTGAESPAGAASTAASTEAGADVPFGRPCGPAFTRFSRPVYPLQARRAGISGLVKLRVFLDAAGDVRNIEVLESGHHLLADAACAAIRLSEFRPYTQNGKSLPSRTVIPIRFSLEQER